MGPYSIIGFWDVIAFDEVAGIKVKDPGTIQILKDYMANGHFNLAAEVIAPASLTFVGNIDDSIEQLVASENFDLCRPLPKEFDLAIIHRFHGYVPGWEIPPNSSKLLTDHYGLITDYLAEAFHHLFGKVNLFAITKERAKLNNQHEGRDEAGVIKTVAGLCKLLHPGGTPSDEEFEEFEEYLEYAIEIRRRVKEQLNKRKSDDEFANINLGYINTKGEEVIVDCPESKGVAATLAPSRNTLDVGDQPSLSQQISAPQAVSGSLAPPEVARESKPVETSTVKVETPAPEPLREGELRVFHGDRGYSFSTLFFDHLQGAKKIVVEDPFVRTKHQLLNFLRFCEMCVELATVDTITLVTTCEHEYQKGQTLEQLDIIAQSLTEHGVELKIQFKDTLHDRAIRSDNGWVIQLGRGLDIYLAPDDWFEVGSNNYNLRKCRETTVTYIRTKPDPENK
ncbi:MAG: BREX system Lon protease-like protein BrxL [Verrucomicrobiales bacterium]|nr:BREX system Lon protease-like protein BrxL [Verrucomicrobiales bacterium]